MVLPLPPSLFESSQLPPAKHLLDWLSTALPDFRTPAWTGKSSHGRDIPSWFLKTTKSGTTHTNPCLLIGAFHGDEPESAWLSACCMAEWCQLASKSSFSVPIIVIPVFNPDGLLANTRQNAQGVDLNRNYPTQNWHLESIDAQYYGGKHPASETETQWLMALIDNFNPHHIISLHTPYKVINYDGPGEKLAQCIAKHNNYPITTDIGYATPGSFGTYYGVEQKIPVITLELEETPPDIPWQQHLEHLWQQHHTALWEACQFTALPTPLEKA